MFLDATIHFLRDETFVASEGAEDETGEVCVVISNLPSGGLGCDLTAFLSTRDGTASRFCKDPEDLPA